MASIDLRQFVWRRSGSWSKSDDAGSFSASLLKLSQPDDSVTLNGPLSVRVGIHVRNQFLLGGQAGDEQTQTIASYRLDIPPGQSWTYDYPTSGESLLFAVGSNARFQVTIEPSVGGIDYYDTLGVDPYHAHSPCGCKKTPCSCKPVTSSDLPCDFAVGTNRNLGEFFPSACEPCTPGSYIRMPPLAGPRLSVPPASGGCTRTNYFNGMFITKEDLLTDQRNMRIKQQLQNRAMGQGVVWGLGVGLNGGSVVVQPGYAVDCCGNDITITSPYQVDYQALVHDPAAAAELSRGGPRRMHLLLEYFECPEDPRPVHGDACSPETTHCEMGRIRETARLRLVPPRDLDTSGPIQDFLNSLPKPDTNNANPLPPTGSELTNATKGTNTPFTLEALVLSGLIPREDLKFQLQPVFGEERKSLPKKAGFANLEQERAIEIMVNLRVPNSVPNQFISPPIMSIVSASPGGTSASFKLFTDPFPSPEIMFSVFMDMRKFLDSTRDGLPGFVTIGVNSWSVVKQNETTPIATGNTTITIAWSVLAVGQQIELTISTGTEGRIQSIRIPCLTEACDPEGGRLFPVTPPWMHDLPAGSGRAIDFQVLQAALNYVRRIDGFSSATNIAAFNQQLVAHFSKLFDAWCQESLYRGPRCVDEPHGVVIGCAVVDNKAGRIVSVDPWGGRRWVLHFPLITHWTGLAGVAPLDYLASKVFEFICCIALYGRRLTQKTIGPQLVAESNFATSELLSSSIALGTSQLVFDSEESLAKRTNNAKLTFRKLGFAEFLQLTLNATVQPSTQPINESAIVYSLTGFDRFFLIVPETQVSESRPDPKPVVPNPPLLDSDSIQKFVGRQISINNEIKPIPRLLRSLNQDLSIKLMRAMPLAEPVASETRLLEQLKAAGIGTVAELLSADAERLLDEVLKGNFAMPLGSLLDSNDQQAVKLVASVASVTRDQSPLGLNVRGDLQNKVLLKQFAKALMKQLNESLGSKPFTEKAITQLVEELVGATQ